MSKGTILGAVRIGQTTYKAGDEEAFAAAASASQIERLTEKKAISGFKVAKAEAEKPADEPKTEKTKAAK